MAAPTGFSDTIIWSNLVEPTALAFAPDGKVFVGQKSGVILQFDSTADPTPQVFADLQSPVFNGWDRGLLGMTVDPGFGTAGHNFIYVLYTRDAKPNGSTPSWNDNCPGPPNGPGPNTDGCPVTGTLSRLPWNGGVAGPEQVLIQNEWCQQYPSHSMGNLAFGADGSLYVSAGDGASFDWQDFGQGGGTVKAPGGQPYTPVNPCGDPPGGVGTKLTSPTAMGGSMRSQSVGRPSQYPRVLNGSVLRVDPATGAGLPTNPMGSSADANARRIIAYGLRNPFRFTINPNTGELWVGDVGQLTWEEIDRVPALPTTALNNGWPCYEAGVKPSSFAKLNQCKALYAAGAGAVNAPFFSYAHSAKLGPNDTCRTGSSAISGLAFYTGSSYPAAYNGALFFGDYARSCIWVMRAGANGVPDPSTVATVIPTADHPDPVSIQADPISHDIFYVDINPGTVHRITYAGGGGGNRAPVASFTATPNNGASPLHPTLNGTGSSDPDGDALTYSWDLNGDQVFGDATGAVVNPTFSTPGVVQVRLRVQDPDGLQGTSAPVPIYVGDTPPRPVIDAPLVSHLWSVGETIPLKGHADDTENGALSGTSLKWSLVMLHCPSNCHEHVIGQVGTGTNSSFVAPDHEYPSSLQLTLTATDSWGLSASTTIVLDPKTVQLMMRSQPTGLRLLVNGVRGTTPFARTVIVGSLNTIEALTPQSKAGKSHKFKKWSDGGAAGHTITAPSVGTIYKATFS